MQVAAILGAFIYLLFYLLFILSRTDLLLCSGKKNTTDTVTNRVVVKVM